MTVTSLASFKEAKNKEEKLARRRRKRSQPRSLGGRVYTCLYRDRHCDHCIFPIRPGEQYLRIRYVGGWGDFETHFWYERSHWPQCYGPSEDEDREMQALIERQREEERRSEQKVA